MNLYSGTKPYWLEVPAIEGIRGELPSNASIVVVGSGFTGASLGYFLQENGFDDVLIVDDEPTKAATFRNAGHILHGTVESMKALKEIHGSSVAKEIWSYSIELCDRVRKTIQDLKIDADYRQDGYLVIAVSEVENRECLESVEILNSMGFDAEFVEPKKIRDFGFKNVWGARYEKGSADAHPGKFRNGIIKAFQERGGRYLSGVDVRKVEDRADGVTIRTSRGDIQAEAAVIATNAYTPLLSDYFKSRGLVEPFRGQIIVSKPFKKHQFKIRYPHSFDHGYEYALVTPDNRLLVGGWRNHSSTMEMGTHSIEVNNYIEEGLKNFVQEVYDLAEPAEWEYSWSGIMGSTKTGFPFIGATNSDRIYCCVGYNGHGFSWGHGCAKLLADMIAGLPVPEVSKYFSLKRFN